MTRIFLTFLAISTAVSGMIAPASAENQPAQHFENVECEIDTAPLGIDFTLPDTTKSILTLDGERDCAGEASTRNVRLVCTATLQGYQKKKFGNRSASGFPCGIFVGICGLSPPFVTTTDSSLNVTPAGVATLQCFHKPQ